MEQPGPSNMIQYGSDTNSNTNIKGADILTEFLEVAIHNVLYARDIYPSNIFVRRQKYGIPVQMSVHPYLNEYIKECLKAVRKLLKKNEMKKMSITFSNAENKPVERFVFDIINLKRTFQTNDPYLLKGEEALRGFCLKLSVIGSCLKPLPENSTFSVHIHTTEAASVCLASNKKFQDFPWIEIGEEQESSMMNSNILPIRTLDTDFLKLQIYIEESGVK